MLASTVVSAQEVERPLIFNAHQLMKSNGERQFVNSEDRGGGSLQLPFFDDFSRYSLPTSDPDIPAEWQRWSDTSAYINSSFAVSPPTIGVATLDGLNGHGYPYNFTNQFSYGKADTLTSLPIDLSLYSPTDNVYLMFFYQGGGLGNNPNESDSLVLEFYSPFGEGEWFHKWSTPGSSEETFQQVFMQVIEPEFLLDGFKFRFRNYSTLSGAFDHWHIDYVFLDEGINPDNFNANIDDVAMQYPNVTLLGQYTSMPWTHFLSNPSAFMTNSIIANENNLGATSNIVTGYSISYQGATEDFPNQDFNTNNNAYQEIQRTINLNGYVFDDSVNDSCAVFDVCMYVTTTDAYLQNDTACFQQVFTNYYAYDDGTAERAYAIEAAGGNVAVKYRAEIGDTLLGVLIHWIPYGVNVDNQTFLLRAWQDVGGAPGPQIVEQFNYNSPHYYLAGPNIFSYYEYDDPIFIPEGNFYVGWSQPNSTGLNVGNDKRTNTNQTKLFYSLGFNQPWEQSTIEGSVMIHPVFRAGKMIVWDSVNELQGLQAMIFPNPADDVVNVMVKDENTTYVINIYDLTGRRVMNETVQFSGVHSVNIAGLPSSTYLLTITDTMSGARYQQMLIAE